MTLGHDLTAASWNGQNLSAQIPGYNAQFTGICPIPHRTDPLLFWLSTRNTGGTQGSVSQAARILSTVAGAE